MSLNLGGGCDLSTGGRPRLGEPWRKLSVTQCRDSLGQVSSVVEFVFTETCIYWNLYLLDLCTLTYLLDIIHIVKDWSPTCERGSTPNIEEGNSAIIVNIVVFLYSPYMNGPFMANKLIG